MTAFPGAEFMVGPGRLRNGEARPVWLDAHRFVARIEDDHGQWFRIVDARSGERSAAFDHERVAARLAACSGLPISAAALPFDRFAFGEGGRSIRFLLGPLLHECALGDDGDCRPLGGSGEAAQGRVSPDGRWSVVLRGHDLWLLSIDGQIERQLTQDGEPDHGYAGSTGNNCAPVSLKLAGVRLPPLVLWSPDSRRFLTHRIDQRGVPALSLLQHAPGGAARPQLHPYRYSMVGDPKALLTHLVFDVDGARVEIDRPPLALPFVSPLEQGQAWWSHDAGRIYLIETAAFARSLSLLEADAASGETRCVLEERGETFVELGEVGGPPNVAITRGGEIVWYSRRDGHAHLYRYELASGALLNRITDGDWTMRRLLHIDEAQGLLWFSASGREPGAHPLHRKIYRVGLDGHGLSLLTPEDADHELAAIGATVNDPLGLREASCGVSPGGEHLVYTRSRPDLEPLSRVTGRDGGAAFELHRGELIGATLDEEMRPEPFEALAADGCTPLYGTLYRPRGFDPRRRYALIDAIYPGPQARRVSTGFAGSVFDAHGALAMAQRGFVVFTIDGRGTPDRSQAFLDASYGRLSDAGSLDDHVAVVRQLAERHAFIDATRVGLYGFSGGGYAAARALLLHPQTFRAAVAGCGNHHQHRYIAVWGETYDGPAPAVAPDNTVLAERLQGALLLIHGELDDNVHPAHTMALAQALIAADKDFQMLLVPNVGHAFGPALPYVFRRSGDFLLRELGGAEKSGT